MTWTARRTSRHAWLVALAIVCVGLSISLEAQAQGQAQSSLDLTWNAPATCPERAWVLSSVQRLVTTMPAQRDGLRVTANAREEDGRWVVDLEMHGAASGTRTLRAASCISVARATALIVALALDPQAATLASEELAKSEPAMPETSAPPRDAPTPTTAPGARSPGESRTEPPRSDRGPRPLALLGAALEHGLLPDWAPAATVGAGVVWRILRADIRGQIAPAARTSLARAPTVGAEFSLLAIALRACAGHSVSWVGMHACASIRGARIAGEGSGATVTYRQTAWLTSFEPGVLLRIPSRSAAALEIDIETVLPLTRPDFVIVSRDVSELLFRVPSVGVRGSLGASIRF
jgi:hypothetical protein